MNRCTFKDNQSPDQLISNSLEKKLDGKAGHLQIQRLHIHSFMLYVYFASFTTTS